MSAVELHGVSRVFPTKGGPVVAVQEVDLTVDSGDWVAITGPSGSGKTTLLNMIAGLDRASHGSVFVLGQYLDRLSEAELTGHRARHIGLVFQDPHLLPGLTAIENLVAARLPWGHAVDLEKRARDLLARVGLDHRVDFPPARMSGGERQRVGIARALLGTPELLLADEPTGNLDRDATGGLLELLTTLQTEMGLTLVVATHDPLVASRAGRVMRLRDGREGAPVPGVGTVGGYE